MQVLIFLMTAVYQPLLHRQVTKANASKLYSVTCGAHINIGIILPHLAIKSVKSQIT